MTQIDVIEKEFKSKYAKTADDGNHCRRFALSYIAIKDKLSLPYTKKVLEVGGSSCFTTYMKDKHPSIEFYTTPSDLRYPQDLPSDEYDIILNMEVLEHIKDQEQGTFHCFDFSGVNTFLNECYRMLKPGGYMLLTTPNAAMLANLHKVLSGNQPIFYSPHVREYAANEVAQRLKAVKFKIISVVTFDVWNLISKEKRDWLAEIAKSCGSNVDLMGEDTFIVAQK